MTAPRAASFSIRTFQPAQPSFVAMAAPRLEMSDAAGTRIAQSCLSYRCWRLFEKALHNAMEARLIGGIWTLIELSRLEPCMADEDLPAAAGVRVASTPAGAPTIEFLDEQGAPIAVAEFTVDVFAHLIGECCDLVEILSKGGLATVECKGQA